VPNSNLRGIIAASLTPLTGSFAVDAQRLARHCERLLNEGCSFVSTFGTTGEGASFSTNEKIEALGALRDAGADMGRHIPAVMTASSDEAGRLVAEIAALGCRGALILPPFYYSNAGEEGIVAFFERLLERAGNPSIDLLLYNIPAFSRITFTPGLIERLIKRFGSRIVGLKDSTGSIENALMLTETFPTLSIFTGDDRVLTRLLEAGGAGLIGGMPNIFSRDLRALFERPEAENAAALEAKAATRIGAVHENGQLLGLKAALAVIYGDPEWARAMPPLMALPEEQRQPLFAAFEQTGYAVRPAA
jgi:4-hydroxy-tetrahydrodipicolinate synthase